MYVLMLRCLMLAVAGALKDLESEKRRTKELQEQLDKALATASGVSVKNNVVFYAAGDGPLTSDELR